MNLYTLLRTDILALIQQLIQEGKLPPSLTLNRITTEPPRDPSHGEISTNAAMVLSKEAGMEPMAIAALLSGKLGFLPSVQEAMAVMPGFVNFRMKPGFWLERLREILRSGPAYGDSEMGQGRYVNIEYPSVNPTGPLHMGHCRISVVGDVMASLLEKAGYRITRESYVNDAGGQALQLARSLYARYLEALGEDAPEPAAYKGAYLIPVGKEIAAREGAKWVGLSEEDWIEDFRALAVEDMMKLIREDLACLGVHLDVYTSERRLVAEGKVEEAFQRLQEQGLIYQGILEAPKGKIIEDWEPREQALFRSTDFGDDIDRPLKKSDGSWTYLAPDIAYHYDKYRRGFSILIDILGADHGGYVKRLGAAVNAMTQGEARLVVRICQMVKFMDQGTVLKMSKRAGVFVTVREAIEKVGKDAIRFMMVTRKNDAPMEFDFAQVIQQSRDNPVFYVQYAHARCYSVLRHLRETFPDLDISSQTLAQINLDTLMNEDDQALIRVLASWPRQVEVAAEAFEPHRIAYYLSEVASAFHALWNKGKEDAELRFIFPDNPEVTQQRFALVWATAIVLASGFKVLGITPVEEMR
ncbi:MAG: arginine--tRNA ligase [Caedimonas sp.]|nr:arginine--tRNA ligase [Caedimonas sp.]